MEIQAAVTNEESAPFTVETVELKQPQDSEVLVRVVGAGVCHTDMIVRDQMYPTPLPAVLGHEGSGVVEQVGANVTAVEPGDRVVISFDYDDDCHSCHAGHPAYCEDFFAHNFGGSRPEDGTSPLPRDSETLTQCGTLAVVGAPALGTRASFDVNNLILNGRSIMGVVEGDSNPKEFMTDLIELYRQGKFPFDELVTYFDFDEIQAAVEASEEGTAIKPILRVSEP